MRAESPVSYIAQSNALGIEIVTLTPCKGKSLTISVKLSEYGYTYALTGRQQSLNAYPGRCPVLCKTLGFQPAILHTSRHRAYTIAKGVQELFRS